MKFPAVISLAGMLIVSSTLFAQTKSDKPFTTVADLTKAKSGYPPPSESDQQEIIRCVNATSAALLKGDIDALLNNYSDQSLELYPNQMCNAGTGNIRKRIKGQFNRGRFTTMDRTVESIHGTGPIALVLGKTTIAFKSNADGKVFEDSGNDIFLFRKQEDGQWKILVHHWFPNEIAGDQPSADSGNIRALLNKWSFFVKPGEVLSQHHLDNYIANYSAQAVEILPNQWSNFGIANIRLRNAGALGVTWAQCTNYSFEVNQFKTVGAEGFSRRAVAWGIGDHSNYSSGADKLSQYLFPWAMILTKESDGQWRILLYHFYLG